MHHPISSQGSQMERPSTVQITGSPGVSDCNSALYLWQLSARHSGSCSRRHLACQRFATWSKGIQGWWAKQKQHKFLVCAVLPLLEPTAPRPPLSKEVLCSNTRDPPSDCLILLNFNCLSFIWRLLNNLMCPITLLSTLSTAQTVRGSRMGGK